MSGPGTDSAPRKRTNKKSKPRKKAIVLTIGDKTRSVFAWSKISGIQSETIFTRLRRGETPEKAVFGALQKRQRCSWPKAQMVRLYKQGFSCKDIEQQLGLKPWAATKKLRQWGLR